MKLRALFCAGLLVCAGSAAQANTLSLDAVTTVHQYQQTTNNPCVIGENSCGQGGFVAPTILDAGASQFDEYSPYYTVGYLQSYFGNEFIVGFDVNQTSTPQQLTFFGMYIDDILVDSYSAPGGTLVPPTIGGGNGNGYADYTFTNFTSLAGYDPSATVRFRAAMSVVNDGREQFFIINLEDSEDPEDPPPSVPEPTSMALLGAGLMAGAFFARHRRQ